MGKLQDFKNELDWYLDNWDWILNGTYGYEHYQNYKRQYEEAKTLTQGRKQQALRRIVINSFTTLVSIELGCSYGHAQKIIVKALGLPRLEKINKERIPQLAEIYAD